MAHQRARDFATLFNVLWHRNFPMAPGREASRADWTIHIGSCVRESADLMGYFARFESGSRNDAVIVDGENRKLAVLEWEYVQPRKKVVFNELKKLAADKSGAEFYGLIVWSRSDHDGENMEILRKWKRSEPLLLFVLQFRAERGDSGPFRGGRLTTLTTYLLKEGAAKRIRQQKALPWSIAGSRWAPPIVTEEQA